MLKKIFLYSIYIIGATLFFLYYLFPSDTVKKYVTSKVKQANPNVAIKIDQVKPAFPPGLKFYKMEFFREETPLADMENLKVMPNLLTVFKPEIRFTFTGESAKGTLDGKGSVVRKSESKTDSASRFMMDTNLAGIQLNHIKAVKKSDFNVSGVLNGNILYKDNDQAETLVSKLIISDCSVDLAPFSQKMGLLAPLFNVGTFNFKTIDAHIIMSKDKTVQIKDFTLKGSQINGSLSGSVMLRTPSEKSVLNLTGEIKPHPSFIASMGNMGTLIKKMSPKGGEEGIPFKIAGTIENPRFSLK